jgi:hypothetical protein
MMFTDVPSLRFSRYKPLARHGCAIVIGIAAVSAASCSKRIPQPANRAPGTPYISWIIMFGDADNPDREFACQSDPRSECVVPVSRPDEQVFSNIHVYYHGAGAETKYEGAFQVGFLQGSSASNEFRVSNVLKKNEAIYNQSVRGLVTTSPGPYTLAFNVTPTVSASDKRQAIQQEVSVAVK